jgi:hypothetical protein
MLQLRTPKGIINWSILAGRDYIPFFLKSSIYVEMARRVKRDKRSKRSKRVKRRSTRRARQQGGWQDMTPANMSAAQGKEYLNIHKGQHGGAAMPPVLQGAPVGETGMLDPSLVAQARTGGTLASFQEIQGMSDQSGGGRRRRRGSRRRQRGGAAIDLSTAADAHAPTHLLSGAQEAKALMLQNPEWSLARNPAAFVPSGMKGGARKKSKKAKTKTKRRKTRSKKWWMF